jgi:hypothetical protein
MGPVRFLCRTPVILLLAVSLWPGCILIRTTEHRISLNPDGSGEAVLRLIDLRSDESVDSLVQRDFTIMMSSFEKDAVRDFEQRGRTITSKRMFTRADTLIAEVAYAFQSLQAVEGLHVTGQEMYMVVNENCEVVRTNGTVMAGADGGQRIIWKRSAPRLLFRIRERSLPPSTSLTRYYLLQER